MSEAPDRQAAELARRSLAGDIPTRAEAHTVLNWPDEDLPTLIDAAWRVRRKHFGKRVRLNYLLNVQSGLCGEDCHYCSQSRESTAPVEKYKLLPGEDIVEAAKKAVANHAGRMCIVASFRKPTAKQVETIADAVRQVKQHHPHLELCACLGMLQKGQGKQLRDAGVDRYNHNLNTSENYYDEICTTHSYAEREQTVKRSIDEGLSSCSGALFGMGESHDDIIDVAYRVRSLKVASIPINFLIPFEGTPLHERLDGVPLCNGQPLTPRRCLKILCAFRLICPDIEIRIAGGRELHLRHLQPLGLYVANSIFVGDYLTTEGQPVNTDVEMIRDLGFEIEGDAADGQTPRRVSEDVKISTLEERFSK